MTTDDRLTYLHPCDHETFCDICKVPVHKGDLCEMTYRRSAFWLPPLVVCAKCLGERPEPEPAVHRGCPVD